MIKYQTSNYHFGKNAVFFLDRSSGKSHLHWHDAIEFVYVLSGSLEFSLNGEKFTAAAGDLITVNSAIVHSFVPCDDSADYYFLVADDNFFRANNLYSEKTFFEKKIHTSEAQRLFCEIIRESDKADEYSNVSTLSVLMSLFIYMNRHHSMAQEESRSAGQKKIIMIRSALVYLQEHYKERLTVERVAEACHFSKSYLSHTFKEITGISIIGYINLLRCHNARALILEGGAIAEAAADCGYSDLSYFTRVFKKTLGILPSEVRDEIFTLNSQKS